MYVLTVVQIWYWKTFKFGLRVLDILANFLLTKWSKAWSNKHGIYEFHYELSNNLRLRIIGNYEISRKSQNFIELKPSAQSFSKNKNFVILANNCWKIEIDFFPVVHYFTEKLKFVSNSLSMNLGKNSENFCLAPRCKINQPRWVWIFYIFPRWIL